jgi:Ca-activated chloride channel homolog
MRKIIYGVVVCLILASAMYAQKVTQGELDAIGAGGKALGVCPLKNTNVEAEIAGFLSRVKVTQEFENNFSEKIEAVYVFPLPQNAAVDDMTMRIGERVVRGKIMKREEAREVYEAAKSNGQIAGLLDQERPNVFTQAVANILPGEKVTIEISYVETLKYEDGSYEFMFPMTVGPRYIPGAVNDKGTGTTQVPDASKITPSIAKDRAGHDISIHVKVDAGVPVEAITSKSHDVESNMLSSNSYDIKLKDGKTIPNKDFILRYDVAGKKIEDAVLTHRDGRGGYFTMILQPPDKPEAKDITPKEIVFVLDTSGSMGGFPIEKAKESMKLALDGLNPQDTFNLITFAGDTAILFDKPVPATADNLKKAQDFLEGRTGGGGTEMMKAIKAALDPSDAQDHIRIVCFMTDGYVGNDMEIIGEIQKHPNARVFSFGIGSSVNRFLLDKMAEEGRGDVEYVALDDDGSAAAKRFHERVRSPLLTDISLDFGGLKVEDVYPKHINDLFSAKPVVIHGRFTQPGSGVIRLKGRTAGREVVREIPVTFPEAEADHEVLATLWARTRIDDLMSQDYQGAQNGNMKDELKNTIVGLGLEYHLLTQFTSFVAVEEQVVTDGGQPRRIEVPVELPEGVNPQLLVDGVDVNSMSLSAVGGLPVNGRRVSQIYTMAPGPVGAANATYHNRPVKNMAMKRADKVVREKDETKSEAEAEETFMGKVIKAKTLPKPAYPAKLKTPATVEVEVALDLAGSVVTAKAIKGDANLYHAAEAAAKGARFAIPDFGREVLKISGVIVYQFKNDKTVAVTDYLAAPQVQVKPNKYSTVIRALVERMKANQPAAADEAKFVAGSKANILLRLSDLKAETVAALQAAGVEIVARMASSNAIVGRISLDKLAALTDIDAVVFILPQNQ